MLKAKLKLSFETEKVLCAAGGAETSLQRIPIWIQNPNPSCRPVRTFHPQQPLPPDVSTPTPFLLQSDHKHQEVLQIDGVTERRVQAGVLLNGEDVGRRGAATRAANPGDEVLLLLCFSQICM